jgi:hypothetical protein
MNMCLSLGKNRDETEGSTDLNHDALNMTMAYLEPLWIPLIDGSLLSLRLPRRAFSLVPGVERETKKWPRMERSCKHACAPVNVVFHAAAQQIIHHGLVGKLVNYWSNSIIAPAG